MESCCCHQKELTMEELIDLLIHSHPTNTNTRCRSSSSSKSLPANREYQGNNVCMTTVCHRNQNEIENENEERVEKQMAEEGVMMFAIDSSVLNYCRQFNEARMRMKKLDERWKLASRIGDRILHRVIMEVADELQPDYLLNKVYDLEMR